MSSHEAFIGLGSNLGEPRIAIERALRLLPDHSVLVGEVSSLYRSEPVDAPPQPWFSNAVAAVRTSLDPPALLRACQAVETLLGRRRTIRHGPRTIDLDLLLYDDIQWDSEGLQLPHPRLHLRRFVLEPLAEIAPRAIHPRFGTTIEILLDRCPDASTVLRCGRLSVG